MMFLVGLTMIKGVTNMIGFFFKQGKIIASIVYFAGFFFILIRWSLIGMVIQLCGIYMLFKSTIMGAVGAVKPASRSSEKGVFASFVSVFTGGKAAEDTV
eukprot:TRINITY_DN11698_c0_g1_i3.p2 TRINITY_DN11698_c0_g1~~TRINITY_DN11698_c0_g1_i3.p2  ORF type:complete len:100 (+),score=20.39 TRINITY_DN11698_c0_g1_i3:307-606(+)